MPMEFCELCQNETMDCMHLRAERWEKEHPKPRPKLHFAKSLHEQQMDRIRGTSRYCEQHNSDILLCCVPAFRAQRRSVRPRPAPRKYTPLSRATSLAAWLAETDHYVSCVCSIRHEPPVCTGNLDSLDDL
jgi:hypothetical protein